MTKFQGLHTNIKIRLITDFSMEFVLMAILPFMAVYFSSHLGAGTAGLLLAFTMAAGIGIGLWTGHLSDVIGRKRIIVTAQGLQVLSLGVMALASSPLFESVWLTFAAFLTANACFNAADPPSEAMIIDYSSEAERPYVYQLAYWLGNVAYAFGAVIGGLFFESGRFYLFVALFLVSICIWYVVAFKLKEKQQTASFPEKSSRQVQVPLTIWKRYAAVMKDRRFLFFLIGTVCIASLEFQLDKYVAVRLDEQFHMVVGGFELTGVRMFSLIMFINTLGVVFFTMPVSARVSSLDYKKVLAAGLGIYTVAFGFFGFSTSFLVLLLAAAAFTLGEIIYIPVRQTILAGIVHDDSRGSYMAMESMMYNTALLLSSFMLTASAVIPAAGMSTLFILLGAVGFISYRLCLPLKKSRQAYAS